MFEFFHCAIANRLWRARFVIFSLCLSCYYGICSWKLVVDSYQTKPINNLENYFSLLLHLIFHQNFELAKNVQRPLYHALATQLFSMNNSLASYQERLDLCCGYVSMTMASKHMRSSWNPKYNSHQYSMLWDIEEVQVVVTNWWSIGLTLHFSFFSL